MKRVLWYCKDCNGTDLKNDAWAVWDIKKQEMVLETHFDYCYCETCDGEASLVEKELSCDHKEHEDCMICVICHDCKESLDEFDRCTDCTAISKAIYNRLIGGHSNEK